MSEDAKLEIPEEPLAVSVLTGFLGSGKTTLLRHLLAHPAMEETAVIVNEFGEIGIDNDLIVESDEEIYEMNNGCVCCTVRGDLIRIIEGLMKRKGRFDAILVETTGLAKPAPVAQEISRRFADIERQGHHVAVLVDGDHVLCRVDRRVYCAALWRRDLAGSAMPSAAPLGIADRAIHQRPGGQHLPAFQFQGRHFQ